MLCGVQCKKDITEGLRLVAKLNEDRRKEGSCILLSSVLEIEKEIGQVR